MANSSGGTKKSTGAAKKNTSSRSRAASSKKANATRPIRREVGAVVCAFLGIFSLIGYI